MNIDAASDIQLTVESTVMETTKFTNEGICPKSSGHADMDITDDVDEGVDCDCGDKVSVSRTSEDETIGP
jgi:hypothetical protein